MQFYVPLKVSLLEIGGLAPTLRAMRLPKKTFGDYGGPKDLDLAHRLIKGGNDHAKCFRGIIVWFELEMQVGWMIEFETYRHGVECLSTSSAMHMDLGGLSGAKLADKKQADLATKVYSRIVHCSYQALRSMYKARRNHRHPDWQIFCDFIETLPEFNNFIIPEAQL